MGIKGGRRGRRRRRRRMGGSGTTTRRKGSMYSYTNMRLVMLIPLLFNTLSTHLHNN